MNIRYLAMLAAGLAFSGNALAGDGEALARKSNCMTCHMIDKPALAASFKEIAAKYKDDKGAQTAMEKKVRNGGAGAWGEMPMPATAKSVTDEEIKIIMQWVLSLK